MNKKARLKLIKKAYYDTRRRRRKLTPKTWQLIRELREESELSEVTDTVIEFREEDIEEEISLMGPMRRVNNSETEWDISHYYDTNLSLEKLYFQGPKHLN
jgi:hypothetical protein